MEKRRLGILMNRHRVFCAIEDGHDTQIDIVKETGLSYSAVGTCLNYLLSKDQIHVEDFKKVRKLSGPRPKMYKIGPIKEKAR